MKQTYRSELPPLPAVGASGPEVCAIVGLYLAIWDDLQVEQQQRVLLHVRACRHCAAEQQRMHVVTQLVQHLSPSRPSERVDQAVMAAITVRTSSAAHGTNPFHTQGSRAAYTFTPWRVTILVAAAAVVLFAVITTVRFTRISSSTSQAFLLPATLTWAGFVLYHSETRMGKNGQHYTVIAYHNMKDGEVNVETVQQSMLDVVAVSDEHKTLGLDMMHHVAQWGADEWMVDESMFNLGALQNELRTHHDAYLGTAQFKGTPVYRIRCENGRIVLLDMHYMPVNVLYGGSDADSSKPMYDSLRLLSPSQVSSSMWNMSVPSGFTMGALPAKP